MPTFKIYIIPREDWNPKELTVTHAANNTFRQLLYDCKIQRRRIAKGTNLEAERLRYSTYFAEIENKLYEIGEEVQSVEKESFKNIWQQKKMPFICPSKTHRECYFEMIVSAHVERIAQQNNLNASFTSSQSHYAINPYGLGTALFPPESLDEHIQYLEKFKDLILSQHNELQDVIKQRLKLIKDIQNIGAGLLEVMEDLDNAPIVHGTLTLKRNENTKKEITPEISYADLPVTETLKGRQKMIERLSLEIEKSLPVNGKINMSNQPHEVSSTVLGRFLFKNDSKDSGNIRIVYADGSEAKPFPLRMLVEPTEQTTPELFVLSTALMSMRHLELDSIVDWAWYRNKEVSQTRPLAESDEFCFQYSIKQIEELYKAYEGKPVLLKMYHTGFEPAVIGFYRALVLELSSFHRRGWLQVNPYYYRGATNFQPDEVIWQ